MCDMRPNSCGRIHAFTKFYNETNCIACVLAAYDAAHVGGAVASVGFS
jgi:ABC-type xylose transport system substrate-binding protein